MLTREYGLKIRKNRRGEILPPSPFGSRTAKSKSSKMISLFYTFVIFVYCFLNEVSCLSLVVFQSTAKYSTGTFIYLLFKTCNVLYT